MSITLKVVNFVDRLKLTNYFIEENNKVHLSFAEFNPQRVEAIIDRVIRSKGKKYNPNEFELNCIRELENV